MIIDFHTHTFPEKIAARVLEKLSASGHVKYFSGGSLSALAASMREAGIDYSINLPVMTRPDQVVSVHDHLLSQQEELEAEGILSFGGLHPAFAGYKEEMQRLKEHGIRGIKLHPAFQGVRINDISYKRIIACASELGLITIVHCGEDISFLGENFASVPDLLEVIREVAPERFVLAHMGGWQAWDQVKKDLAGAPVWLDTAYSLGPVAVREGDEEIFPYRQDLDAESFTALARQHGTDRVLFATDSPWAGQKEYLSFLKDCPLTESEKEAILGKNAAGLLGLA